MGAAPERVGAVRVASVAVPVAASAAVLVALEDVCRAGGPPAVEVREAGRQDHARLLERSQPGRWH